MSNPLSPPESLEQLAPGVVLGGRYSLKERVPRWIAERRFRARDLESGTLVAVLIWSAATPWFDELARRLEELPEPLHRETGTPQGYGVVVLDWVNGMHKLEGGAASADEALRSIQAASPAKKRTTLPARKPRNGETEPPPPIREPALPTAGPAPAADGNPRRGMAMEWAGLILAALVAVVVIWFAIQLGRALSEPIIIERKISVTSARPAPAPATLESQLEEAVILRKNGNATAALQQLMRLQAAHPADSRILDEINSLLTSLQADLPAIRAGFRPGLRRAIDQLAAEGVPGALRLAEQLTKPAPVPTNSP